MSFSNKFGANPADLKWDVVRGDTATLRVEFYEQNQKQPYNTDNWAYICTVYNRRTKEFYYLDVDADDGVATITATPEITSEWGTGIGNLVAQLDFDLEITMEDGVVWTPVIGTISVMGDITGREE
jgi:hypothetical protein